MSISDIELCDRDKLLKRITTKVIDACYNEGIFNSCLTCVNFNEQQELCMLANPPARPPARVIAYGCQAYSDEIPF